MDEMKELRAAVSTAVSEVRAAARGAAGVPMQSSSPRPYHQGMSKRLFDARHRELPVLGTRRAVEVFSLSPRAQP